VWFRSCIYSRRITWIARCSHGSSRSIHGAERISLRVSLLTNWMCNASNEVPMRFLFNLIHVYPAQFNDIQPMSVVCHFTLSLSASHFRSWTTRESGISDFDFVCKRVATKYVEEDIPRVISTKSFILLYYGNRLLWPIHEGLDEIEVNCYLKPERKPGIGKV
jgi:hypothetical protein